MLFVDQPYHKNNSSSSSSSSSVNEFPIAFCEVLQNSENKVWPTNVSKFLRQKSWFIQFWIEEEKIFNRELKALNFNDFLLLALAEFVTSQIIPDFGVSTAFMLSSRNFPKVVQVGLSTLARKWWTVRQNIQTTSLLSNILAKNNSKSRKKEWLSMSK